ncbi:MAG: NapC/NirT family cytochrome c [Cocleimonas sp.]|nr:NapC/NirT family cytochrome c [Cocleimonas sp.]
MTYTNKPSLLGRLIILLVIGVFSSSIASAEDLKALEKCETCHSKQASEFQESVHYINRSGVQATCNNCHANKKHKNGVNASKVVKKPRIEMVASEWKRLKDNNSKECKTCHSPMAMDLAKQEPRSVARHEESFDAGNTSCINCHQGISHYLPDGWEKHKKAIKDKK